MGGGFVTQGFQYLTIGRLYANDTLERPIVSKKSLKEGFVASRARQHGFSTHSVSVFCAMNTPRNRSLGCNFTTRLALRRFQMSRLQTCGHDENVLASFHLDLYDVLAPRQSVASYVQLHRNADAGLRLHELTKGSESRFGHSVVVRCAQLIRFLNFVKIHLMRPPLSPLYEVNSTATAEAVFTYTRWKVV